MAPHDPPPCRQPVVGVLLGVSLACNVLALCLPFVVIDAAGSRPWTYGLLGSVRMLAESGMWLLAGLVVGFSVLLPFAKLAVLARVWWHGVGTPGQERWLARVERIGKWSLFDVFLVAVMVGLTDDQWLISSASLWGTTCFLFALLLGMVAGELLTAGCHTPVADAERSAPSGVLLVLLLAVVGVLLTASMLMPVIQISDWLLTDRAFSLVALVPALWHNGSPALALCVAAFLIAAPLLGWGLALAMTVGWWRGFPPARLVRAQQLVGRWSMLPVFALSLAVFLSEGDRFLGTEPRAGMWMMIGGLALTVVGQYVIDRLWRHR